MANRRLAWTLDPITARQAPIAGVEISLRVDPSLPWDVQDTILPEEPQELLLIDVPPGTFYYRAVIVDNQGNRGGDAEVSAFGLYDPPGVVSNFTVTEE